ncbi:MAG: sigma 54-dependent Fis family transcriptional regulator [Acidobacteria bacterium]|nr:sigma 54-dependent Fis family transcriptional regulator [Acidobacteriota bacterium]
MNPRLFAISGLIEGAFFILPEQEITIGSDPANLLVLDDPAIASFHCIIQGQDGEFHLRRSGAGGALAVNGLSADERALVHGDEIRIGGTLFLYLAYEAETPADFRLQREIERLELENRRLQAAAHVDHDMVGDSPAIRAVCQFIAQVAPTDSTVLICGESGTGKELVARAIHRNSRRAGKPFVAINCAAITETLLESEMFGHEKGSFTGAVAQKRGKLEAADGGTVFLDEIGEMVPALQAKLLRVLQEHEFERVGGTCTVCSDLRIIAATNRDLADEARRSAFRQDLYYRLNVVRVTMPPLRDRRADIPLLAQYFVRKFARRSSRPVAGLSPEARDRLMGYDWPGNVRELENSIERAIVLGSTEFILPEDLPETLFEEADSRPGAPLAPFHEAVNEAKKQAILRAFDQAGGSYTECARRLGLHPNYLHRLIRNLDVKDALKARAG